MLGYRNYKKPFLSNCRRSYFNMGNIRSFKTMSPSFDDSVFIDLSAVVIGDVVIGSDSSVWPLAVIRGDMHKIRIGERTSIQDGSILHITHAGPFNKDGWPLSIGSEVTIGHKTVLHGCEIHDHVLVGNGAIIMDGAVIPKNCIVGANCLVPPGKKLESGYLYVGSPCKKARALTEKEISFFSYTANNYVKLKNDYLKENKTNEID